MSEHELMIPKGQSLNTIDQQNLGVPSIEAYEPERYNENSIQQPLRQFYRSLEFPCCMDYQNPNLRPIAEKKKQMNKNFVEEGALTQQHKLSPYDGIYSSIETEANANNQQIRLKTRLVRDKRQQYFQQNSQFIVDTEFFYEHLSRLANISFQENYAIQTFQKNAILSQRNNQKKNMPFQLQINLGCLWITKHQLQNQEQKKFEQLRPMLKQFSDLSTYPTLFEIERERDYLFKIKQTLVQTNAPNEQINQVIRKLQVSDNHYRRESQKIQKLMRQILDKWRQIKQQRRSSGMQTVPWKLNVKEYEIDRKKSFDIGISPTQIKDKNLGAQAEAENRRRQSIKEQKYFVKIYINGYEVAKSEKANLQWPSFRVPINQKFNVTVYSAPSSIQVQILKSGIINSTIDTINISLPGINSKTITASERRFAGASFSSNGQKYRKGQDQQQTNPAGIVVYRIEWKGQGSRMPPVSFKAQEQQTAATQQTEEEIDYPQLYDIKDPRIPHKSKKQQVEAEIIRAHAALLPFVDTQSIRHLLLKMKAMQPQFQRLDIPLTQQEIYKRQDLLGIIEKQKQKTLDQGDADNQDIYNPMQGLFKKQDQETLKQIKQLLLKIYNLKFNTIKGSASSKYKITEQIINQYIFQQMQSPIAVFFKNLFTQQRKLGPKKTYYLQAINVIDKMQVNIHMKSAKNVPIRQKSFAIIRNFRDQEANRRNSLARLNQMGAHTGNVDMYSGYGIGFYQRAPNMNLQGQRFFVPGGTMNQNKPNLEANYQSQSLQRNNTYFEMRFKKLLKRIQCFQGPHPEWNETLQFNYDLKLEQMTIPKLHANNQKSIKLFLFDMVEQSKPTTAIAEVRIRKSKYFLGRIDIPMSMLVAIPNLSGLFIIQRPLILFGYGIKKAGLFEMEGDAEQEKKTEFPQLMTLVSIDMFTDPGIDSIHAYNQDRKFVPGANLGSGVQSTLLLQRCSDWLSNLNTKKYIRLWLNNVEGKSVFICRYLSDHCHPPPILEDSIQRCARFVSMIPRKYNCKLLQNTQQFHLTCQQLLNLKMGEDHGILLCNYFNFIDSKKSNLKSYLLIGKAFPYGKSIFVLRKNIDTNDCQIWDPYTGNCFYFPAKQYDTICCFFKFAKKENLESQKDSCNLLQVACVVSDENVYINKQDSLKPSQIDFDFNDTNLWLPFLTQRMRKDYFQNQKIQSIQTQIQYKQVSGLQSQIEKRLYDIIRGNLETQRKKHFHTYTFRINTNVSNAIRNKILVECQNFKMDFRLTGRNSGLYQNSEEKYRKALEEFQYKKQQIKQLVDSDKLLYGFTMNLPYTTSKDIWQKIQQTQIHLDQTENIEFVLAIRCFELACHIYSVWIFVGSIKLNNN